MASQILALTYLLCLNLVFFTLVSSNYVPCPPPPSPKSPGHHGGYPGGPSTPTSPTTPQPTPATPTPKTPTPATPIPKTPTPTPATPIPKTPTPATPTPKTPTPATPSTPTAPSPGGKCPCSPSTPTVPSPLPPTPPTPTPATPSQSDKCPIDILKLAACANVLTGLADVVLGVPPQSQCCPLLGGLTDLDAAICLCTALEANVLGINLDIPLSLTVLLNFCHKAGVPSGFQCPSTPGTPTPATPAIPTPTPATPTLPTPTPATPTLPTPTPTPATPVATPPTPSQGDKCPIDVLKLATCANVLTGLVDVVLGVPPQSQCCPLLGGLTDLDAAICLCTAIKANVLGINLDVPVSLSVLLNFCDKAGVPSGFQCS